MREVDEAGVQGYLYSLKTVDTSTTPALLWLHGGGYILGKPLLHEVNLITLVVLD